MHRSRRTRLWSSRANSRKICDRTHVCDPEVSRSRRYRGSRRSEPSLRMADGARAVSACRCYPCRRVAATATIAVDERASSTRCSGAVGGRDSGMWVVGGNRAADTRSGAGYASSMRDRVAVAPPLAKFAVAIDACVRCGALVVASVLIRELWGEVSQQQPNTDGLASVLLVPMLVYVAWSLFMLVMSIRRWREGSLGDASLLAFVGGLSAVRLMLLRRLVDERSYFDENSWILHKNSLIALIVASGVVAGVAGFAAIHILTLAAGRAGGSGDGRSVPIDRSIPKSP